MKKIYLNCVDDSLPSWNKRHYLLNAAKRVGLQGYILPYNGGKVDNVLNIEPYGEFIKGKKWTGIWSIDCLLNKGKISANWKDADNVFIAGTSKDLPINENVQIMFQAVDVDLYNNEVKKDSDIVKCCSTATGIYEKRNEAYSTLENAGFNIKKVDKGLAPHKYIESISSANVQFVRSMEVDGEGEIAQRFFECLMIGPVLTNNVPDLKHTGLIDGEDYMSYNDNKEMLEKMKFLLSNPDEASRIARNGKQKALMYHTYDSRLLTILQYAR